MLYTCIVVLYTQTQLFYCVCCWCFLYISSSDRSSHCLCCLHHKYTLLPSYLASILPLVVHSTGVTVFPPSCSRPNHVIIWLTSSKTFVVSYLVALNHTRSWALCVSCSA